GGSPFPPTGNVTFPQAGVYINMPRTTRPTYVGQWNVSYQRQFAGHWLASVTYLGNKTTHLWVGSEVNPAVYVPGASTTANTNQRRVLYRQNPVSGAYYASINQADEGSNAHYNAQLGQRQSLDAPAAGQLAHRADHARDERPGPERHERPGQFTDRNEQRSAAAGARQCVCDEPRLPAQHRLRGVAGSRRDGVRPE